MTLKEAKELKQGDYVVKKGFDFIYDVVRTSYNPHYKDKVIWVTLGINRQPVMEISHKQLIKC